MGASDGSIRVWATVISLVHVLIPSGSLIALYFIGHLGRFDASSLYGIYAVWGSSGCIAITSLLSLISTHTLALIMHVACQISLSSAAAAVYTGCFFSVQHACQLGQVAMSGCNECPCAQSDTCTAQFAQEDENCSECTVLPLEGCSIFTSMGVIHILLLLIGVLMWAFSMVSASFTIVLIFSKSHSIRKRAARDVALSLYVDHQTKLLAAGDKPTVTPSLLQSWVSELLLSPDIDCKNSATLCRVILQRRGYTMKVIQDWNGIWTSTEALKALSQKNQDTTT